MRHKRQKRNRKLRNSSVIVPSRDVTLAPAASSTISKVWILILLKKYYNKIRPSNPTLLESPEGTMTVLISVKDMQVTAQLNNLRISPRKVRLVARAIKGMDAMVAKHQLDYIIKKSSNPISKLLNSAMANGHNSFGLVKENLFIKDIVVNEGPKLKRFRPKGFGMASPIEKKTSHIKIVLEEKVPGLKAEKTKVERPKTGAEEETVKPQEVSKAETVKKRQAAKPEIKKEIGLTRPSRQALGKKGGIFSQVGKIKKFFRRKTI